MLEFLVLTGGLATEPELPPAIIDPPECRILWGLLPCNTSIGPPEHDDSDDPPYIREEEIYEPPPPVVVEPPPPPPMPPMTCDHPPCGD